MQQMVILEPLLQDECQVQELEVVILEEAEPPHAATQLALSPTAIASHRRRRRPQLRSPHRQFCHRILESSHHGAGGDSRPRTSAPRQRSLIRNSPARITRNWGISSQSSGVCGADRACAASPGAVVRAEMSRQATNELDGWNSGAQEAAQYEYELALATSATDHFEKYQEYIARRV